MTLCDWMYERNTAPTFRSLDDIRNADMAELSEMIEPADIKEVSK